MAYTYEIVSEINARQRDEWERLWQASGGRHVFNSPVFFEACCRAHRFRQRQIFLFYKDKQLSAVLPLVQARFLGINALIAPGSRKNYADKFPLLLAGEDKELARYIFRTIETCGSSVYLAEADELFLEAWKEEQGRGFFLEASRSPWTDLAKGDVLQYMSSGRRRDLRSKLRRCEADMCFEFCRGDRAKEVFSVVIEIEERSRKQNRGTALLHQPVVRDIFRYLLADASNPVGIGILFLKGEAVAHFLGFAYGKTFALYHTAFDDRFSKLGIGKIAVYKLLQYLQDSGFEKADLLRGDTDAKRQFSDQQVKQYDLYISKNNSVLAWWRMCHEAQSAVKRLRYG